MSGVPTGEQAWLHRSRRARTLLSGRPQAEPFLRFYLVLLELQSLVCEEAVAERWGNIVVSPESQTPRLRLEALPLDELTPRFDVFCRSFTAEIPEPILRAAKVVAAGQEQVRRDLLASLLKGEDVMPEARDLGCEAASLAFLPRAFLQPIAEAISGRFETANNSVSGPRCPQCGWPPQVSVLADEPAAEGNRRLVCAFCAAAWTFPRSVCPGCLVSGEDGLEIHVDAGELDYVRVESCTTCRRYLKSVDLRVSGLAVPLVDDIATPELDLWAADQGFEKITPHVLGL